MTNNFRLLASPLLAHQWNVHLSIISQWLVPWFCCYRARDVTPLNQVFYISHVRRLITIHDSAKNSGVIGECIESKDVVHAIMGVRRVEQGAKHVTLKCTCWWLVRKKCQSILVDMNVCQWRFHLQRGQEGWDRGPGLGVEFGDEFRGDGSVECRCCLHLFLLSRWSRADWRASEIVSAVMIAYWWGNQVIWGSSSWFELQANSWGTS